ncbi:MAG: hypothetical protein AB8E82_19110 [Aureispira sp.]
MDTSLKGWLLKTILFQSILLVGFSVIWLFFMILIALEVGYYTSWKLAVAALILGWTGYVIIQLYQNIQATNAFRTTEHKADWQKAMQHQLIFWKHVTVITLLYLLWSIFLIVVIVVFTSWGDRPW